MSGLQRRLLRLLSAHCIDIVGVKKVLCSYADDLKLMATSEESLQAIFAEVERYLGALGLRITNKCEVLVIGTSVERV